MMRSSGMLRICLRTRVLLLSPSDDVNAESSGLETLEASIRSFTQHGGSQDVTKLKSVMDELIHSTDARKVRLCKEVCRLAHAAGYHALCTEFFFSCRAMAPILLSDLVINAAALSLNPKYLRRCLSTVDNTSVSQGPLSHETLFVIRIYWQSTSCFMQTMSSSQSRKKKYGTMVGEEIEEEVQTMHLAQYRDICEEAFCLLHLPGDVGFDDWWSRSKRLVLYQVRDRGEAAVYDQHFSWWIKHLDGKSLPWLAPEFLSGMIRTCARAERWDLASRYLEFVDAHFFSGVNAPHDVIVLQCLNFFSASMQSQKGVVWMRRIRDVYSDYIPSVAVVHATARLAGDTCDEELAVWCLQKLISGPQSSPISSKDIFPPLAALAKCRVKSFKKLLYALEESALVKLTEEERLHLDLLHSRHGLYFEEEVIHRLEKCLTYVSGSLSSSGLSVRNASLLFRILQEGEHPGFMKYYEALTRELCVDATTSVRAQWVATALKWALSQAAIDRQNFELLVKEARALLHNTLEDTHSAPLNQSLRSTLRSRLWNVEQLWGKQGNGHDATTMELNGDVSLARFVQKPRCLPQSPPPWIGRSAPRRRNGLWRAHEAFSSFAEREWRRGVQGDS